MYSQSFTASEMWKCVTPIERRNRKLTELEFTKLWNALIGTSINDGTYTFSFKKVNGLILNNCHTEDAKFCQTLILRKIANNYRKLYYIQPSNRNAIVRDIISLLNEDGQYFVLRLDIKSFYESIDVKKCLTTIQNKERASVDTVRLTRKIFESLPKSIKGLPRGVSVSAALSELYMKYFDNVIKQAKDVVYYARFVDDIIIMTTTKSARDLIYKKCQDELAALTLSLNNSKMKQWKKGEGKLYFLGYNFSVDNNKIQIEIAENKINKIKMRLTRSFRQYIIENDFKRFEQRVQYLTGNFKFNVGPHFKKVHVGIRYNYTAVTEIKKQLIDLDTFYKRLLFSNNLGINSLNNQEKYKLAKYSFWASYNNKIHHHFSVSDVLEIKKAWV